MGVWSLDWLRHGTVGDVVDADAEHGRLGTAETAEGLRERLVADDWEAFDRRAADRAVMVALRRSDVPDLNRRARALLAADGGLVGPTIEVDGTALRAGDRVVCLRTDRRVGVVNGTRGTVTAVADDHRVRLRGDDGRLLDLPARYVDAGWLDHGYAITAHKAATERRGSRSGSGSTTPGRSCSAHRCWSDVASRVNASRPRAVLRGARRHGRPRPGNSRRRASR